jgi:hypothetical protein
LSVVRSSCCCLVRFFASDFDYDCLDRSRPCLPFYSF